MGGTVERIISGVSTGGLSELYNQRDALGGSNKGEASDQVSDITALQLKFARDLLKGKIPPAFRTSIENQYNVAKNQAMDFLPRGGQLNSALLGLNQARSESIGTLPAQLLPMAFGALGQAQQASAMSEQAQAQKKQGTGQALGKLGGGAIAACWIAVELYGYASPEFFAARHWIFNVWKGPIARIIQRLYLKHGRRAAEFIKKYPALKMIVRPLFDIAVRNGKWAI